MLYKDYIDQAKNIAIAYDEATHMSFLIPEYRYLLKTRLGNIDDVEDYQDAKFDIAEVLDLEVTKRNILCSPIIAVAQWLSDTIFLMADPAMIEQSNDFIKSIVEYMKLKDSVQDKEAELKKKENALNEKQNVQYIVPGINFAKKTN